MSGRAVMVVVSMAAVGVAAATLATLNRPGAPAAAPLGLTGEQLDAATAARLRVPAGLHGVVVTSVAQDGEARRAGVAVGDVVLAVDGAEARARDGALDDAAGPPPTHHLTVWRGGETRSIDLP